MQTKLTPDKTQGQTLVRSVDGWVNQVVRWVASRLARTSKKSYLRDFLIRPLRPGPNGIIPTAVLGTKHFPRYDFTFENALIDTPRANELAIMQHLVAGLTGRVIVGALNEPLVHKLHTVIL